MISYQADKLDEEGCYSNLNVPRLLLGIVLGVSLAIRIYYLYETSGQPVWWDEANYLVKAKSFALGTPSTGYDSGRPILFSILMAPFFALGLGEFGIRLALTITSLLSVYLVYRVGTRLMNPWVGVMGAALFSCHYLSLFYTERIMCEIPYVTLALLAVVFFLSDDKRLIWASGPLFSMSVMLRYPAFMIPVCILVFILITERTGALRKTNYWVCFGLALLTMAPDLLVRGLNTMRATSWLLAPRSSEERLVGLWNTTKVFFGLWDPVSKLVLIASLLLAGWYILSWKSRSSDRRQAHLLLALLLLGPILLQGLWITHLEDRYLYGALAPACLLIASACWHLIRFSPISLREKVLGISATCLLCICGVMLQHSTLLTMQKRTSYEELRIAGDWLKNQKDKDAVVVSQSVAQITYYSEMSGVPLPQTQEEFFGLITSGKAKYAVITGLEVHPDWAMRLDPQTAGLEVVLSYPEVQPRMVVLKRK